MSCPEDYFEDKYEELRKKILDSLGTPQEFYTSTPFVFPNIYMQKFKEAIERNLAERDKTLLEKMQNLNDELEKYRKNLNKKHRSIDEPFKPSMEI